MIREFDKEIWNGETIFIWGAGKYGQLISKELLKQGISKVMFTESKPGETSEAIPFDQMILKEGTNIILGSMKYMSEMYDALRGIDEENQLNIFTAANLIRDAYTDLTNHNVYDVYNAFGCYCDRQKIIGNSNNESWYIYHLIISVTEVCNLNCEGCISLVSCYRHPRNADEKTLFDAVDRLLETNVYIGIVSVIGGEPLINQKLMEKFFSRYGMSEQIGFFKIVTNGTILPSESLLLEIGKIKNLFFIFSNYGELSKRQEEAVKLLEKYNIVSGVDDVTDKALVSWNDYGEVKRYENSDEHFQQMFEECIDRKETATLINGKLGFCHRIAHAINLGLIPKELSGNYVDLLSDEEQEKSIREQCEEMLNQQKFPSGCFYCNKSRGLLGSRAVQINRGGR